jgi:hypothetical protein
MGVALGLISLLTIKHFVCDFLFQTGNVALNKHNFKKLESYFHAITHALFAIICLGLVGKEEFWYLGLVSGAIHYGIDWTKGNLNAKLRLTPDNTYFWWLLGADQMMHTFTYIGLTAAVVL